jgi:hypothetical protein
LAFSIITDTNVKQAGGVVNPSTQSAKKKPKTLREKSAGKAEHFLDYP